VVAGRSDSLGTAAQARAASVAIEAKKKIAKKIVRRASREKGTEYSFAESLLGRGTLSRPAAGKVRTV
jgi:hypothetical protein